MVNQFQLVSGEGKVLAHGEIDGETGSETYRVFSREAPNEYQEFSTLEDMFATCGGVAIQPMLFETPARTRQPNLFQQDSNFHWRGDTRPKNIDESKASLMYQRREDNFRHIGCFKGHPTLFGVFKHDKRCHICGSENTMETGSEINHQGDKVCYIACHDCQLIIGNC